MDSQLKDNTLTNKDNTLTNKDNTLTNKSKNFESNKLINPDIIEDDLEDEEEENYEEEIDEIDEDTRSILYKISMKGKNSPLNFKSTEPIQPQKEHKKKSVQKSKNMSLQDFIKNTPTETIPVVKKFTSNRVESKKKHDDSDNITLKRQFSPRKPPFNFMRKTNNGELPQINNFNEFPALK